ncbi:MAG: hypothetical protein IPM69_15335 [Ignavibacteria bacterium]|nr:hypothetical protein [Ignavibacteria bacterium]
MLTLFIYQYYEEINFFSRSIGTIRTSENISSSSTYVAFFNRRAIVVSGVFTYSNDDSEKHAEFKANQYQLYLILLTLWGYDFRRQVKRLEWIIEIAQMMSIPLSSLTVQHILSSNGMSKMEVFFKFPGSSAQYFHIFFTWILLFSAVLQIIRQMILLFLY